MASATAASSTTAAATEPLRLRAVGSRNPARRPAGRDFRYSCRWSVQRRIDVTAPVSGSTSSVLYTRGSALDIRLRRPGFTRPWRGRRAWCPSRGREPCLIGPSAGRMKNSRPGKHNVRLRGPFVQAERTVSRRPASQARRAPPTRAGEALFVPRLGARQGLGPLEPRVHPPRRGPGPEPARMRPRPDLTPPPPSGAPCVPGCCGPRAYGCAGR